MPMLPAPPVITATFPLRSKSSEAFIGQSFLAALTATGSYALPHLDPTRRTGPPSIRLLEIRGTSRRPLLPSPDREFLSEALAVWSESLVERRPIDDEVVQPVLVVAEAVLHCDLHVGAHGRFRRTVEAFA